MNYHVAKTGVPFFDTLHAYGLGILLATATGQPVTLQDEGMSYRLSSSPGEQILAAPNILEVIWRIPTIEELSLPQTDHRENTLPKANLDGLLAALFTQPGSRLVSVADLLLKARRTESLLAQGLQKVQQATAQWKRWAEQTGYGTPTWLGDVLRTYRSGTPALPAFSRARRRKDLGIWMTLEPSLGFSTRRPWNDGIIDDQITLTLSSPPYSGLLVRIGATRFLRAQPVAGQMINYYLPLPCTLTLHAASALPGLPALTLPSDQALTAEWLNFVRRVPPLEATWDALAYQVLQVQGVHAPMARQRGVLPFDWITPLTAHLGYELIHFWRSICLRHQKDTPYELDALLSFLITHQADAWMAHLREQAWAAHMCSAESVRRYSFQECKELMNTMPPSTPSPLRSMLERKQGTLRFGRALRLLGHVNHASLVETLDLLEEASTLEQLNFILGHAIQDCALASAKSPFIVIPTEEDLKYVGDDVAQYGVRLVTSVLFILSALRYPPVTITNVVPSDSAGKDISETEEELEPIFPQEGEPYDP